MSVLPRQGAIMYDVMKNTTERQSKALKRFKTVNKYFIIPLYRLNILPLLFMGKFFLLLYVKGRKSGKTRITPLELRRRDGKVLIFSSRGNYSDWYKNLVANPDKVKIKIGLSKYKPKVEILPYPQKLDTLIWYTNSFPKAAKALFGYRKEEDEVSEELLKPIAEFIEIIQFTIS